MRRFVKLTEDNDWEGETWHFWLQLDGNQAELDKLAVWLEEKQGEDDEGGFSLNMDRTRYEDEVDLLVEEADYGYMKTHNKVVGIANFGDLSLVDDPASILYKGRVEDFFS
jgi:hypothetical protein